MGSAAYPNVVHLHLRHGALRVQSKCYNESTKMKIFEKLKSHASIIALTALVGIFSGFVLHDALTPAYPVFGEKQFLSEINIVLVNYYTDNDKLPESGPITANKRPTRSKLADIFCMALKTCQSPYTRDNEWTRYLVYTPQCNDGSQMVFINQKMNENNYVYSVRCASGKTIIASATM